MINYLFLSLKELGYLDEEEFKRSIWNHRPITDIWNIGRGSAERLEKFGIFNLRGIAEFPEEYLYKEFGVNAKHLIDHAHGRENCTIKDIKDYKPKSTSISNGQVLFKDYKYDDALIILKEMIYTQTLELVEKRLVTDSVSLHIRYSKDETRPTGGSRKLGEFTNSCKKLTDYFVELYTETTNKHSDVS